MSKDQSKQPPAYKGGADPSLQTPTTTPTTPTSNTGGYNPNAYPELSYLNHLGDPNYANPGIQTTPTANPDPIPQTRPLQVGTGGADPNGGYMSSGNLVNQDGSSPGSPTKANLSNQWGDILSQIQNFGGIQQGIGPQGQIQTSLTPGGSIQDALGPSGSIQNTFAGGGPVQTQNQAAGAIQGPLNPFGQIQQGVDFSQLNNYKTSTADAGGIQKSLDNSNVPGLVGGDALRQQMLQQQQASYQNATGYLDPQWKNEQTQLENHLASQGVMQNSEAWNKAMDDFGRQKQFAYQQAYSDAVSKGNTAQQMLFGEGLSANQNQFGQNLASGQFSNAAQAQAAQQAQFNATLANMARQQQAAEMMQQMQLHNQAQSQGFGQNLAQGEFANTAQAQQFGQNAQNMQLANAAQQQTYLQNLGLGEFANTAQSQAFGQGLAGSQFANAAQQQGFGQNLAGMQAVNAAQQQGFGQNLAAMQATNAAQGQGFAQNQAQQQAYNAAQKQLADQGLTAQDIAARLQAAQYGSQGQIGAASVGANASMTNTQAQLAAQQEQNRFLNSMAIHNQDINDMLLQQMNPWDLYNMISGGQGKVGNLASRATK